MNPKKKKNPLIKNKITLVRKKRLSQKENKN